ncbi:MAG: hypothetical protein WB565_14780 [Acidimicrobiales bacterium]
MTDYPGDVSVEDEIANLQMQRPHVVLLGAGASRAAAPDGDRAGRPLPLMRDVADVLGLGDLFPPDLQSLVETDFESAYSKLFDRHDPVVDELNDRISAYFGYLLLPDPPGIYDYLLLCLREKDAVFTFNWDPLLVHARIRLAGLGVNRFPKLFFLHGNAAIGYCERDEISGITNRGAFRGQRCSACGELFAPSRLLFPVTKKNYQADPFTTREWKGADVYLRACFMLTVFGYSAPATDVEAIALLKTAWGDVNDRALEQTEIICRPGANRDDLRAKWDPFIHTHHYEIVESFFDSWMSVHPRRTGEAYWSQYMEAQFISNNPVPIQTSDLRELVAWFRPLLDVEDEASGSEGRR